MQNNDSKLMNLDFRAKKATIYTILPKTQTILAKEGNSIAKQLGENSSEPVSIYES